MVRSWSKSSATPSEARRHDEALVWLVEVDDLGGEDVLTGTPAPFIS
jgi:hypothetical protein